MQSSGIADTIQVTNSTYQLVKGQFPFTARGEIEVKGGIKVDAFLYKPAIQDILDKTFDGTFGHGDRIASWRDLVVDVSASAKKRANSGPSFVKTVTY